MRNQISKGFIKSILVTKIKFRRKCNERNKHFRRKLRKQIINLFRSKIDSIKIIKDIGRIYQMLWKVKNNSIVENHMHSLLKKNCMNYIILKHLKILWKKDRNLQKIVRQLKKTYNKGKNSLKNNLMKNSEN